MIVYVEANFIMEIVRQQEECDAAELLLVHAEKGRVQLRFPVFALCEPFSNVRYKSMEREAFEKTLRDYVHELGRVRAHKALAPLLRTFGQTLLAMGASERDALDLLVSRLLAAGSRIDFTAVVFREAQTFAGSLDLKPLDAIVYASILSDLAGRSQDEPKCFVSRDVRAFSDPSIRSALKAMNCRYIRSYADALAFVESQLPAP